MIDEEIVEETPPVLVQEEEAPPVPVRPEDSHPSTDPVPPPDPEPFEEEEFNVAELEEAAPTADQINDWFSSTSHSVNAVNQVIDGTSDVHLSQEDKNDHVDRNVKHLQIQEAQQWYIDDSESRTAPADKASISAAITAGKAYMADNGYTYEDYEA